MGIFLGTILNFNLNKSLITFETKEKVQIGDTISIESEKGTYTVSEIIPKKRYILRSNFNNRKNERKF